MIPDYDSARAYTFDQMARHLPPGLPYHGLHHTRDQVLPAVELFCREMNIAGDRKLIIATAALFHDIGFIRQYTDNEIIGAETAASVLPDFGYSTGEIAAVRKLIMATRMPQQPESVEEKILCDADLATLGQDIFFETSMMLRRETETFLNPVSLRTWFEEQYAFLTRHRYFTSAACDHLNATKEKNRIELQTVLHCPHDFRQAS